MKIENVEVYGFKSSLRGMRNPLDSWNKSDSYILQGAMLNTDKNLNVERFILGEEDRSLAQRLTIAGSEHCKFLRQIHVWFDLTLPRYIWSEFDTYHYNTKNSCSTMHTVHKRYLTQEDFEYPILEATLDDLNDLIRQRKEMTLNASDFIHMIKNRLPEGFLQKRTVDTNYSELLNIFRHRHQHRLVQWHNICDMIYGLPYFTELTGFKK